MGIAQDVKIVVGKIEIVAEDLLNVDRKIEQTAPAAAAALGVVLKAADNAIVAGQTAAQESGLNISLDEATWAAVKPLWPDVKALAATLGIKL